MLRAGRGIQEPLQTACSLLAKVEELKRILEEVIDLQSTANRQASKPARR